MPVITHENIIPSKEFAEKFQHMDITRFYRGLIGCLRTQQQDEKGEKCMGLCQATPPDKDPSSLIVWHIEKNRAIITDITNLYVKSCTNCDFWKR